MFVPSCSLEGQFISISAYVLPHNVDNRALHRGDALVQSTVISVVGGLVHFYLG